MTPLDLALAVAGHLAATIERRAGGSRRATWGVVIGLVAMSAIPTLAIGSSQRPTDLTFDDVRFARIPAMTSWVRLEGELRSPADASADLYELHDTRDDTLYVTVTAPAPLPVGHAVVTGRLSQAAVTVGSIGSIRADVPAEPRRDEPFQLILLPAALGIFVAVGIRVGYPVVRRERPSGSRSIPLAAGERMSARWSGWIGSTVVTRDAPTACTVEVSAEPDLNWISLTDVHAGRTVRMRRSASAVYVRSCRVGGCEPGLEIHARSDDLILTFDDRAARDRLAATLE
jgi:hypothetical protein